MDININGIDLTNGKKVLLIAPEDFDDDATMPMMQTLRERFPEVDWSILTGGFQSIVFDNEGNL